MSESFFNAETFLNPSPTLHLQNTFAKHDRTDGLPGKSKSLSDFQNIMAALH